MKKSQKSIKHEHGAPNPILLTEERAILAAVDRALASSGNSQVIGRNGEVPFREFLNRYLPYTFKAATGHFVSPAGRLSPQIDVLILDARYPLLASNADGSVLAMMHGVIGAFEVKTRLAVRDLAPMWRSAITVADLAQEVPAFDRDSFATIRYDSIAYRITARLSAIDDAYVSAGKPKEANLDVYVLRLPEKEQPPGGALGAMLHFEPLDEGEEMDGAIDGHLPTCGLSHTPLSDLYYRLVQDSYYTLNARAWTDGDIGQHVMDYMAWATCSWEDYERLLESK